MISIGQILAAGIITGVAVGGAGYVLRWPSAQLGAAAVGSLVLIVLWRLVANLLRLNGDVLPAVSIGDVGCLFVGAIAPAAAGLTIPAADRRWLPAGVGAIVGFVVNVVIL